MLGDDEADGDAERGGQGHEHDVEHLKELRFISDKPPCVASNSILNDLTMCLFLVAPEVISMPMQKRMGTACSAMATNSFHTSLEVI